LISPF